jgi:predicted phage terminase large subunit-like protein
MTVDWRDHFLAQRETTGPKWATPGAMAQALDPRTIQTPALELIDQKLVEAFNTPDSRLIISMPPQEGKSQRASRRFPLWALTQNRELRIAMASYEARIAERWGRTVRDDIRQHPNLGLTIRDDVSAQREWQLDGHDGGMFSTGVGGAMTGRPVDILLIDDPVKGREQADSPTIREKTWEWWTDTALSRLAPGAPVIIILTRWHSDDLAGRLIAEADSDWEFLNIPAQADHRPEKGETDVLDREPGEFMLSARGRTTNQWEARKKASGPKTWASLYQGRPSPDEGGVFPKDDEWARYDQPLWIEHPDGHRTVPGIHRDDQELVQSWDLTFKDTKSSDYVVGQVWLRVGTQAYLLDQVRERLNFTQTVAAITAMTAKWPEAVAKFIEDKANGPAVINALNRQVNGLIPIEPEGSKYARASAISPLVWSKDVILPEPHLLPNVTDLLEEAKHFPNSPTDDTVDALSQAINRILLLPILNGGFHQPDEYDLMDERGWTISPW